MYIQQKNRRSVLVRHMLVLTEWFGVEVAATCFGVAVMILIASIVLGLHYLGLLEPIFHPIIWLTEFLWDTVPGNTYACTHIREDEGDWCAVRQMFLGIPIFFFSVIVYVTVVGGCILGLWIWMDSYRPLQNRTFRR